MMLSRLFLILFLAGNSALASPTFHDFSGICNGGYEDLPANAVGWLRIDLSWGKCQPVPGQWDEKYLETIGNKITEARRRSIKTLLVLGYNSSWSAEALPYSLSYKNKTITFEATSEGKILKTIKSPPFSSVSQEKSINPTHLMLSKKAVDDWAAFVGYVVSYFSRQPYSVEYFQVWNEAHPDSGFWQGDLDSYIQRVHLPAAKAIREHGGKVVYGGWPIVGQLDELVGILDRNQAWNSFDVMAIHYSSPFRWLKMLEITRSKNPDFTGFWQTEFGFSSDPGIISNNYPRMLYHALGDPPFRTNKDFFKLFYFAGRSPDSPGAYGYGKCLLQGKTLATSGREFNCLSALFGDNGLRSLPTPHNSLDLTASLDIQKASIEHFDVGDRFVLSIHLDPQNLPGQLVIYLPRTSSGYQLAELYSGDGLYHAAIRPQQLFVPRSFSRHKIILTKPVLLKCLQGQSENNGRIASFYLVYS